MKLLKRLVILWLIGNLSSCGGEYVPQGYIVDVARGDLVMVPYTFIDPHSQPRRFQLVGIISPDPDSADESLQEAYFGILAKNFSEKWADDRAVTLERPFKTSRGLTDRNQGWVKDVETNEYLHESLVTRGLARADLQGRDLGDKGIQIVQLEAQAKAAQKGMWSPTLPNEHEMRKVVQGNVGLFGRIVSVIRPSKDSEGTTVVPSSPSVAPVIAPPSIERDVSKQVVPQPKPVSQFSVTRNSQTTTELPKSILTQGTKLLQTINSEAEVARREFLKWQSLSSHDQQTSASSVRQKLRSVKIHVMDAFDEGVSLNEGQKIFLQSLKDDMNRLMGLVPR